MEEQPKRNRLRNLLVLSMLINLILAVFTGYASVEGNRLRGQIDDLTSSHNLLLERARNMEQQLNFTVNQLEYYKGVAEYYSNLTVSDNASTGIIGHTSIPIVAAYQVGGWLRSELRGVVMTADVELREGEGRVLVDTVPKIGIDIQTSVRTAVRVAEEVTGVPLSKTDVILTIRAEEEVEIVDGPSAGAAITLALVATINNLELGDGVYITGTVQSDSTIGPVGGVPEKAVAAAEHGARRFIVPPGQSTIVVFVPKTTSPTPGWTITTYERQAMSLQDYLSERGYTVTVEEVESIGQALTKFTAISIDTT